MHYRAVRIYQPTKSTMQSGKSKYNVWKIDWDVLQGAARWENKLMGWGSSCVADQYVLDRGEDTDYAVPDLVPTTCKALQCSSTRRRTLSTSYVQPC